MQDDDPFIGKTFPTPRGGTITVLGSVPKKPNKDRRYWLSCSICSLDDELWPEGSMCCLAGALRKGCVPCSCSRKPTMTAEQYEIKAKRILSASKYRFSKIVQTAKAVCAEIVCPDHGVWECPMDSLQNRKVGCQKCSYDKISSRVRKPQGVAEIELSFCAAGNGHKFIGFKGEYSGANTRAVIECPKHGVFDRSVSSYLGAKSNCSKCRYSKLTDASVRKEHIYIGRINSKIEKTDFSFNRWDGDYSGVASRVILDCPEHGEFSIAYGNIMNGSGCQKCAKYGFRTADIGFVYILESIDKSVIKVGVANKVDQRINQLRRTTPIDFEVLDIFEMDGRSALDLESACHHEFMSAELTGFDGCTEWMRHDPAIIDYIQQRA